jgi:putative FmdB family regulatory protein
MPMYDYVCSECQHTFDKILKIAEKDIPKHEPCPKCGKTKCIDISLGAPALMSPFRVEGLKKPSGQFRERIQQIKKGLPRKTTLKDY